MPSLPGADGWLWAALPELGAERQSAAKQQLRQRLGNAREPRGMALRRLSGRDARGQAVGGSVALPCRGSQGSAVCGYGDLLDAPHEGHQDRCGKARGQVFRLRNTAAERHNEDWQRGTFRQYLPGNGAMGAALLPRCQQL